MTDLPWDAIAADWDRKMGGEGDFFQRHLSIPALNELISEIEGAKILDAGCGNGFLARYFDNHGADVTGIDTAEALIDQAREYEDDVDYQVTDIVEMDLDAEFDIIVCNNVIQHIEDYEQTLERFDDHLKDDGTIVITVRHPCFKPIQEESGWQLEGGETIQQTGLSGLDLPEARPRSFKIVDYFDPERAEREFNGATIPIINRTLSEHMQALTGADFCVTGVQEPKPGEDAHQERPDLCSLLEKIPHFLVFRAERHS